MAHTPNSLAPRPDTQRIEGDTIGSISKELVEHSRITYPECRTSSFPALDRTCIAWFGMFSTEADA